MCHTLFVAVVPRVPYAISNFQKVERKESKLFPLARRGHKSSEIGHQTHDTAERDREEGTKGGKGQLWAKISPATAAAGAIFFYRDMNFCRLCNEVARIF